MPDIKYYNIITQRETNTAHSEIETLFIRKQKVCNEGQCPGTIMFYDSE